MDITGMIDALKKGKSLCCRHCGAELDPEKWVSEWDQNDPINNHYKSNTCVCGEKKWIRVEFSGSGHDRVLNEPIDPIESTVKKVREG